MFLVLDLELLVRGDDVTVPVMTSLLFFLPMVILVHQFKKI